MSFRATEASRLHSARPIPLGDWLSARAHTSNMRCVLRALRVTQLPDGKGPRLLQPCVIQFSSAPAHVFIDAHLRVGAGGGFSGGGLVDRSIGRLIDRPVDKKDELAAFRQPPWAFVFVMWRHSVCHLHVVRSALAFGSSARLDWLFSGWSPRAPPGHALRLSLVLEVNRAATNRVESAEAQQGRFVLARTRSH